METKKDNKRNRRTKTFLDQCDKYILEKMIQGLSAAQIEQLLVDEWDFETGDNARKAIRRVNNKLSETNKEEIEVKVTQYKQQYQDLYKNARDAGEWKTAGGLLDSLVKLEGLLTQKIEAKIEGTFEVTFD